MSYYYSDDELTSCSQGELIEIVRRLEKVIRFLEEHSGEKTNVRSTKAQADPQPSGDQAG